MWIEDMRYAFRGLRSATGFTTTAVLSLSLAIGGGVSMFTVVNSILLKPLAYPDSGRLVRVVNVSTAKHASSKTYADDPGLLALQFIRWRKQLQSLDSIALTTFACSSCALTGTGRAERVSGAAISAEYFDTLKVQPQLGRWFRESEEQRGAPRVVILTDSFWRRSFSAAPDIVGQTIHINSAPYEVVGVTPPGLGSFRSGQLHPRIDMADRIDIFLPIRFTAQQLQSDLAWDFVGIARLKPGITLEQARAELNSTLTSIPEYQATFSALRMRVDLQELQTVVVRDARKGLLLLLLSVGLVLLIACVNVANLSLVRSRQRAREFAIRVAFGASRRDLIRGSLAESFLLALVGTCAGSILAQWITELAIARAPAAQNGGNRKRCYRALVRDRNLFSDYDPLRLVAGLANVPCRSFGGSERWEQPQYGYPARRPHPGRSDRRRSSAGSRTSHRFGPFVAELPSGHECPSRIRRPRRDGLRSAPIFGQLSVDRKADLVLSQTARRPIFPTGRSTRGGQHSPSARWRSDLPCI